MRWHFTTADKSLTVPKWMTGRWLRRCKNVPELSSLQIFKLVFTDKWIIIFNQQSSTRQIDCKQSSPVLTRSIRNIEIPTTVPSPATDTIPMEPFSTATPTDRESDLDKPPNHSWLEMSFRSLSLSHQINHTNHGYLLDQATVKFKAIYPQKF